MSNDPKFKLILHCPHCNIQKEIALTEENMITKDMGIWPLYGFPEIHCAQCHKLCPKTIIKEAK